MRLPNDERSFFHNEVVPKYVPQVLSKYGSLRIPWGVPYASNQQHFQLCLTVLEQEDICTYDHYVSLVGPTICHKPVHA
jgi:hypothetical protein